MSRKDPRLRPNDANHELLARFDLVPRDKEFNWSPHFIHEESPVLDIYKLPSIVFCVSNYQYMDVDQNSVIISAENGKYASFEKDFQKFLVFLLNKQKLELQGFFVATSFVIDVEQNDADLGLARIAFMQPIQVKESQVNFLLENVHDSATTEKIIHQLAISTLELNRVAAQNLFFKTRVSSKPILGALPDVFDKSISSLLDICRIGPFCLKNLPNVDMKTLFAKREVLFVGGDFIFQLFKQWIDVIQSENKVFVASPLNDMYDGEQIEWHGNGGARFVFLRITNMESRRKREVIKYVLDERHYDYVIIGLCPLNILISMIGNEVAQQPMKNQFADVVDIARKKYFAKGRLIWIPMLPLAFSPSDNKVVTILKNYNVASNKLVQYLRSVEKQLPILDAAAETVFDDRERACILPSDIWCDSLFNLQFRHNNGYTWDTNMIQWISSKILDIIVKIRLAGSNPSQEGPERFEYISKVIIPQKAPNSVVYVSQSPSEMPHNSATACASTPQTNEPVKSILKKSPYTPTGNEFVPKARNSTVVQIKTVSIEEVNRELVSKMRSHGETKLKKLATRIEIDAKELKNRQQLSKEQRKLLGSSTNDLIKDTKKMAMERSTVKSIGSFLSKNNVNSLSVHKNSKKDVCLEANLNRDSNKSSRDKSKNKKSKKHEPLWDGANYKIPKKGEKRADESDDWPLNLHFDVNLWPTNFENDGNSLSPNQDNDGNHLDRNGNDLDNNGNHLDKNGNSWVTSQDNDGSHVDDDRNNWLMGNSGIHYDNDGNNWLTGNSGNHYNNDRNICLTDLDNNGNHWNTEYASDSNHLITESHSTTHTVVSQSVSSDIHNCSNERPKKKIKESPKRTQRGTEGKRKGKNSKGLRRGDISYFMNAINSSSSSELDEALKVKRVKRINLGLEKPNIKNIQNSITDKKDPLGNASSSSELDEALKVKRVKRVITSLEKSNKNTQNKATNEKDILDRKQSSVKSSNAVSTFENEFDIQHSIEKKANIVTKNHIMNQPLKIVPSHSTSLTNENSASESDSDFKKVPAKKSIAKKNIYPMRKQLIFKRNIKNYKRLEIDSDDDDDDDDDDFLPLYRKKKAVNYKDQSDDEDVIDDVYDSAVKKINHDLVKQGKNTSSKTKKPMRTKRNTSVKANQISSSQSIELEAELETDLIAELNVEPEVNRVYVANMPWLQLGAKFELNFKVKWYHAKVLSIDDTGLSASYIKFKGSVSNLRFPEDIPGIAEPGTNLDWTPAQQNA